MEGLSEGESRGSQLPGRSKPPQTLRGQMLKARRSVVAREAVSAAVEAWLLQASAVGFSTLQTRGGPNSNNLPHPPGLQNPEK